MLANTNDFVLVNYKMFRILNNNEILPITLLACFPKSLTIHKCPFLVNDFCFIKHVLKFTSL